MHVAIITAGGAGMFCGSCMHDNTWARALMEQGAEVSLIPTYTPIRVDEQDLSLPRVFLGGINVYLEYRWPFWQKLPRALTGWLDSRRLLSLAGKLGVSNDASQLGALTLAMIQGEAGPERNDVERLVQFIARDLKPDVVCFSNALLVGVLRRLRQEFAGAVFCTLQGDDVFLEELPEPYRSQAIAGIADRAREFDGFIVHSAYYREFMSAYFNLPVEKFHQIPLGIDLHGHDGQPSFRSKNPFTIGFFARICPEKGLQRLIEAFRLLHARQPATRLRAGGYLGQRDAAWFRRLLRESRSLGEAFEYVGSPATHERKVAFFKSLDVFSVPTVYRDPKGLPVLEALANGIPVVQPDHGAFAELVAKTRGGILVPPGDPEALAAALERLLLDPEERLAYAAAGYAGVRTHFNPTVMARRTLELFTTALRSLPSAPRPETS